MSGNGYEIRIRSFPDEIGKKINRIFNKIIELKKRGIYLQIFEEELSNKNNLLLLLSKISKYLIKSQKGIQKSIKLLNFDCNYSILDLLIITFEYILQNNNNFSEKFGNSFNILIKELSLKYCLFYKKFNEKININDIFENHNLNFLLIKDLPIEIQIGLFGLDYNGIDGNLSLTKETIQIFNFFGAFIRDKISFIPYSHFFNQTRDSPLRIYIIIIESILLSFSLFFYYILLEDSKIRNDVFDVYLNPKYKQTDNFKALRDIIKDIYFIIIYLNVDNKFIEENENLINSINFTDIFNNIFFLFNTKLFLMEQNNFYKIENQLFSIFTEIRLRFLRLFDKKSLLSYHEELSHIKKKRKQKKIFQLSLLGEKIYYAEE